MKSIILSDLDLPENKNVANNMSDNEYTTLFGRRFNNLNYKNIIYIIHDDYMNNVDRFILKNNGEKHINSSIKQ
jgi:hypothetical protein